MTESHFSRRLREIRESRGMTKYALALAMKAAGDKFDATFLGRLESGKLKPSLETAVRLADFFGVSLDEFRPNSPAKKSSKKTP